MKFVLTYSLLSFFLVSLTYGQSKIRYSYDKAGNRIRRDTVSINRNESNTVTKQKRIVVQKEKYKKVN